MRPSISPALILATATLGAAAASAAQTPLEPAYEALVQQYAGGTRDAAVTAILAWPDWRVRDTLRSLNRLAEHELRCAPAGCVPWLRFSLFPVEAALMLHADAAATLRSRGGSIALQQNAIHELARLTRTDPDRHAFLRRFYAALALQAQAENRWGEALDWAERGLAALPGTADLLLVVASIEESQASHLSPREADDDPFEDRNSRRLRGTSAFERERRAHLEAARRAAREALAAEPANRDASLRLGRVAWRLGDAPGARAALEPLVARRDAGPAGYLASLFLGRVYEDEGRIDEAAGCYQAALAIEPRAQAARFALSRVRLRSGDEGAARAEVAATVSGSGHARPLDPFWTYPWGASGEAQARLAALRGEVTR
jgi:tetratricopeptide (TPR) repeat protein